MNPIVSIAIMQLGFLLVFTMPTSALTDGFEGSWERAAEHQRGIRHYPSGVIKNKWFVVEGKLIGRRYYEGGAIMVDRKLEGPAELYYENGFLKKFSEFKNGKMNGVYRMYHENGVVSFEGTTVDGKLEGIVYRRNKDGELIEESLYREGKKIEKLDENPDVPLAVD